RQAFAHISTDFVTWRQEHIEAFALPDPADPALRSFSGQYDQVHIGVGAIPMGNVCVGLYGVWHNADFFKEFAKISCDFGLVVSNDGMEFREPVKHFTYLAAADSPVTALAG